MHRENAAEARLDLPGLLNRVLWRAQSITNATGGAIALTEENEIVCRARIGETAPPVRARLDPESGISGECFRTGEILYCHDAENDSRVNQETCQRLGIRSIVALPLFREGKAVGVFEVFSTEPYAFNREIDDLRYFAEVVGRGIRAADLAHKKSQRSIGDTPPSHGSSTQPRPAEPAH